MQHFFLLILFVVSPLFIFAQDSDTEKRMQELGFVKVDLEELGKTQSLPKKHCSSCPMKQVSTSNKNSKINYPIEIQKLKNKVPSLEQDIKAIQSAKNPDPKVLSKYQTALKNTKERLKTLEEEFNQSKSTSK